MPKYLFLKHYRGGPEPHHPFPPMDQWAPRGRGGAHGLPEARQRAARAERRVRRRAGAHAGAHLGALRRPGRGAGHHRRPAAPRRAISWQAGG
jgi:hypothetical protein